MSLNRYIYARDNPEKYNDPNGHMFTTGLGDGVSTSDNCGWLGCQSNADNGGGPNTGSVTSSSSSTSSTTTVTNTINSNYGGNTITLTTQSTQSFTCYGSTPPPNSVCGTSHTPDQIKSVGVVVGTAIAGAALLIGGESLWFYPPWGVMANVAGGGLLFASGYGGAYLVNHWNTATPTSTADAEREATTDVAQGINDWNSEVGGLVTDFFNWLWDQ